MPGAQCFGLQARMPAQFTLFPQFPFRKKFVIARARSPVEVTAIDANRPGGSGESPLSMLYCVRALPGKRPSEDGKRIRTSARDRSRRARKRLHRRRRIPLRHGTGALKRNGRGAMGRDLFLRSAARGGTAVLGRIFRVAQREERALAPNLSARKWNGGMGVLRLRLHEEAGREDGQSRRFISGKTKAGHTQGRLTSRPALPHFLWALSFFRHSTFGFGHSDLVIPARVRSRARAGVEWKPTHLRIMMRQFVP
jgi:hypothetical protein